MSPRISIIKSHIFPLFDFPNLRRGPYWFYLTTFPLHVRFLCFLYPLDVDETVTYLAAGELFSLELLPWLSLSESPQASWDKVPAPFPRKILPHSECPQKLAQNSILSGENSRDIFSLLKEHCNPRFTVSEFYNKNHSWHRYGGNYMKVVSIKPWKYDILSFNSLKKI